MRLRLGFVFDIQYVKKLVIQNELKWIFTIITLRSFKNFSLNAQKIWDSKMVGNTCLPFDGVASLYTLKFLPKGWPLKVSLSLDCSSTWVLFFLFPFVGSLHINSYFIVGKINVGLSRLHNSNTKCKVLLFKQSKYHPHSYRWSLSQYLHISGMNMQFSNKISSMH